MNKIKKTAVLAACAGVLAGGAGIVSAGPAAADTPRCADTRPAHTNGNLPNDVPQQANAGLGALLDLVKCTVTGANAGLNGGGRAHR
ncbi:hypothetical protein QOM21_34200 [Streptomyces sp. Pv4-95]|uniref:hypothetical protein n=1 Tax=Streptomyces sp. Pv4-95 TaxID=3049543 RepID=UPI003891A69B